MAERTVTLAVTPERAQTACDQCGQTDDHPKQNIMRAVIGSDGINVIAVESFHHDCLSVRDEEMLRESAQVKGSGPKFSAVLEACKKGAKGDKLRKLIEDPKALPQAEGLIHQQSEQEEANRG